MKAAWYLIKNIALAIGITVIGSYMAQGINTAILWILGIYLIFAGFSNFGETNPWVSLVIIGLGAGSIALAKTVLKDNNISYYISAVFIALIAVKQFIKVFESYGVKKWQKALMKILTVIYPACLIGGAVFAVFLHDLTRAASLFSFGSLLWVVHSVLVVVLKCMPATRGFGGKKRASGSSSSSSGGGASRSKVADEMRSIANYFTGGFDSLPYGTSVKYAVSSTVNGGVITFTVSATLSGGNGITTEQQANSVKGALENALRKRQQLILDKAGDKLESMNPDSDYSINVEIGDIN